jgi:hypothetical protein
MERNAINNEGKRNKLLYIYKLRKGVFRIPPRNKRRIQRILL